MGTEGDSLLVAFPDAAEAVAACLEGQLALSAHPWPPGAQIQVRMGVHTGEATRLVTTTWPFHSIRLPGSRPEPTAARSWSLKPPPQPSKEGFRRGPAWPPSGLFNCEVSLPQSPCIS